MNKRRFDSNHGWDRVGKALLLVFGQEATRLRGYLGRAQSSLSQPSSGFHRVPLHSYQVSVGSVTGSHAPAPSCTQKPRGTCPAMTASSSVLHLRSASLQRDRAWLCLQSALPLVGPSGLDLVRSPSSLWESIVFILVTVDFAHQQEE